MRLINYDLIIINSSAGKDSLVAIYEICRMAHAQAYPLHKIVVSHQDLGRMEWPGTKELAEAQAKYFGLQIYYSKRRTAEGVEETLLEYAVRHGKWPSRDQRWCTSDFKRGPGLTVVTTLTKALRKCKVLHVFGFRADESPARKKKKSFSLNKRASTLTRKVYDYLPVHKWSTKKVWKIIRENNLPYHPAYDLGMPRLSCCFCIFSPFNALVIAGRANPQLLQEYVDAEQKMGHTFKSDMAIADVQKAIAEGYQVPAKIENWIM